ncbi:hypothetical protein C0J52_24017 [Blattella germanica]|nr:hypothetical protein C0J52_24017 [Blattella germanica]
MARKANGPINVRWCAFIILIYICFYFSGGNAFIPVSSMEKGFLPSGMWVEETTDNNTNTMLQEESRKEEQLEKSYIKYEHKYPPNANTQSPLPANPWAPSAYSTPQTPPPQYSVQIGFRKTEGLILQCQHISWIWFPCPNRHSPAEGTVIADGTTVSNRTLYAVKIIGQFGVYISELTILQNPLQFGTAGLYRCEAWPHGKQQHPNLIYHDEFIIGGQTMLRSCFHYMNKDKHHYNHLPPVTYNAKSQKSYRTPRNMSLDFIDNDIQS